MKDLTKYFIDLSKLSEDKLKSLVPILENAGYHVYFEDRMFLKHGKYDKPYFHLFNSKSWLSSSTLVMKQELTYPEFIRLFEGGEGETDPYAELLKNADILLNMFTELDSEQYTKWEQHQIDAVQFISDKINSNQ